MLFALAALLAAGQPVDSGQTAQLAGAPHSHPMKPVGGPQQAGVPQMPTPAERAKIWAKQFADADTNHDGSISRQEFNVAAEKGFAMKVAMVRRYMEMARARAAQAGSGGSPAAPVQH